MSYFLPYVVTLLVFVALDLVWLGLVAKSYYRRELAGLIADQFNLGAATAFYLLYALGIVIFAVDPALRAGSGASAALYGGLFGFFAYATYDLTNLATLRAWPLRLTLVDLAWGSALTSVTAICAYMVTRGLA